MLSGTNGIFQLNCLIEGESIVFSVEAACDDNVSKLKKFIQRDRELDSLKDIGPHTLKLWKVYVNLESHDEHSLGNIRLESLEDNEELKPWKTVLQYWPHQPPNDCLHIIVKVPRTPAISPAVSNKSQISASSSLSSDLNAQILDIWSCRKDLVEYLYNTLIEEHLVYVRGTPACGKTTLLTLLVAYIHDKHPAALVARCNGWPPDAKSPFANISRTQDPFGSDKTNPTFLLFDDAQDTYDDDKIWAGFLKAITLMNTAYRVVLFCSYGSATARLVTTSHGTPPVLRRVARLGLRPTDSEARGLLLERREFEDIIDRYRRHKQLKIDRDVSDLIFRWTGGHVGAVVDLLELILRKMKSHMRKGVELKLDAFNKEFPNSYIFKGLKQAPFARGLPFDGEQLVEDAGKWRYSYSLLSSQRMDLCYKTDDDNMLHYSFASPLHRSIISWVLEPTNNMPQFDTLIQLSIKVISHFKPSQLGLPLRRVGGDSSERPPEAQYQDEFYRCLLAATHGNVRISPEFASAWKAEKAGRIDFFIPIVKWGIEIVRDGDRLKGHALRFSQDGAYGKWAEDEDMQDFILLNFCTKTPKTSDIPFLFHILFQDNYRKACVFDYKLEVVKEIVLLENHM